METLPPPNQKPGVDEILKVALRIGKTILENGGETYRVEETMTLVAESYGASESGFFVTPTGIMVSITDANGESRSFVKRVYRRTTNLERIAAVAGLSRRIKLERPPPVTVLAELDRINSSSQHGLPTLMCAAGLVTGFFTLLFGGGFADFCASFVNGFVLRYLLQQLGRIQLNDFFCNVLGGAIATCAAFALAWWSPMFHADKVTIGSVMLLVPGLAITNAVRDTISGDFVAGLARANEAFLNAIGIAFGSGIAMKIMIVAIGGALP